MYDEEYLEKLSKMDLCVIDRQELTELSQVKIDIDLPTKQRLINFLNDIKNPYCFLVGTNAVKIEFSNNGKSLQTLLKNHFIEQRDRTFE